MAGSRPEQGDRPRVVVIGAGFGGLAAARRLGASELDVTVVDRNNFHTFQPLLYQVATAGLVPADVAYPVRTVFRQRPNVTFRHGRAASVDLAGRTVRLRDGAELPYDYLVLATGAAATFFGIPGAEDTARPLYTLEDARVLRNELLRLLEDVDGHPERHGGGRVRLVVVGGGATGVETAGALVELLDICIRRDRMRIDPGASRVTLVDSAHRLLNGLPTAGRYAATTLDGRGVDVRLGWQVVAVKPDGLELRRRAGSDGDGAQTQFLDADLVVWAGGVSVDPTLAGDLGLPSRRGGRVTVGADLSLDRHPEVFVVGDAAAVPRGPAATDLCPQQAPVAIQSGHHAASQILRLAAGRGTEAFRYLDKGQMATIGRRAAVAEVGRLPVLRGTLGWLAWLGLHLVYLVGFRNRLTVLVNWCWRYIDWPSGPRLIVADVESVA